MRPHWIKAAAALALASVFGSAGASEPEEWRNHTMDRACGASLQRPHYAPALPALPQAHVHNGYSAARIIGMDARGRRGELLGAVQDIILSASGRVAAVLIAADGPRPREIAYRIPWVYVDAEPGADHIIVPLHPGHLAFFRWSAEHPRAGANETRAADIIGGDLALRDGMHAGDVDDLIITRDGRLQALVVHRTWAQPPRRIEPAQKAERVELQVIE